MISYSSNKAISNSEFIDILKRSTLAERRPVNDPERIQAMLDNANVLITAWDGDKLVGVSRAISDGAFCTYLSDLAVDVSYQKSGIGKRLVELTHEVAGHNTTLILLAAPAAVNYYPKIGMEQFKDCFLFRTKA
jgi:GNAT superfamily N-acetyltransferase